MRRVSKLRWSSSVRWHWGLYTSIAKTSHRAVNRGFVRANCWECICLCRPCKLCCKSQQRSCSLKKEDDNIVASCVTKANNVVAIWKRRWQRSCSYLEKLATYLEVLRWQDVNSPPHPTPCKWLEKVATYLEVLRWQHINGPPHPTPCKWLEKFATYLEVLRTQDVDSPPHSTPCKWLEKLATYFKVLRWQDVNRPPHPTPCKWLEKSVT